MSRAFDDIKSVNDSKELWKLAVRLEDIWTVTNGGKEHIEFLILDKQGDQIQVLLPSKICPMWKTSLKEGETYVMKNFKVHKNDFSVMSCVHPFKLVLVGGNGGSKITPLSMPDIPHYKLHFKPFPEIMAGKYRRELLVDVIGAVYDIKPSKQSVGGKKQPTRFSLRDADMNDLPCTLWGDFGTQFMDFFNEKTDDGPMVIVIKHAQIKEPQGQYDLCISNAWTGSKLILDPQLKEICDFKKSLPATFGSPTLIGTQAISGNM